MRLGKKIVATVLCIVLGVGSVAACGKKEYSKETSLKAEASAQDTEGTELPVEETEETIVERESYENQGYGLRSLLDDEDIYVLDVYQEDMTVDVLTSDHIVAEVDIASSETKFSIRVPEDTVELMGGSEENTYVVKNESGEISMYKTSYSQKDEILEVSPEITVFEGQKIPNYCFNVALNNTFYNIYLDGKTLKLLDLGEAEGAPLYLGRENLCIELFDVREIQIGSETFVLLENNEAYCISPGIPSGRNLHEQKSQAPDAAEDEMVFSIDADELPLITDANKIFSIGWWGMAPSYVVYEQVGDIENIHARSIYVNLDDPDLVFKLPEGYTTSDVAQLETATDGMIILFSDGSIYLIEENELSECLYNEKLSELYKNGHILEITGGDAITLLMDDYRIYDLSF